MNRVRVALSGILFLLVSGVQAAEPEFGVFLKLGLKDTDAVDWSGTATVTGGEISEVAGWHFAGKDRVSGGDSWTTRSRDPGGPKTDKRRRIAPTGVLIYGRGSPAAVLTVTTAQGAFDVALAALAPGRSARFLGAAVSAERIGRTTVLSAPDREADYPSLCVSPAGSVWCVWQAYRELSEQLFVASCDAGVWSDATPVPGAAGDLYKSACVWAGDRLLVVWARFEDGDWDLFSAEFDGREWTGPVRLTAEAGADVEPAIAYAGGSAYLVWQSWRGSHSDIRLKRWRAGAWGADELVTSAAGNDWMPQVAAADDGTVAVVWDSYRNGNYDVYLRQLHNSAFGPEAAVAASPAFEAYATVAIDGDGRTWVAYEEGTENWGKDQGAVVPNPKPGTRLYSKRASRVRVYDGGRLYAPLTQPESVVSGTQPRRYHEKPRLCAGSDGRIHLCMRWAIATGKYLRSRGHYRYYKAWESHITSYDGQAWTKPVYLPNSIARLDSYAAPAALPDGRVAVVWHTDSRTMADIRKPVLNRVVATVLPASPAPAAAGLKPVPVPVLPKARADAKEIADTARVRAFRTSVGGTEHAIVRGDLHRHTEVSWDGSGDGSMVDVWRYAIDAGALDFLEITDHNQRTGPDLEYVWWRTEKLTDVYNNPPHFISLFGYERSLSYPNGHRNIINAKRGYRTFPMTRGPNGKGVAGDDTKQLYANERDRGSVIISHTSGTRMGTDWRDNDPVLEPVVEIYQGARTSYEYEGAPKSATPGDRHAKGSGYQPQGFVWRAWEKGLRLGIIASSDHGSTHISYANVFVDAPTREAIVAGLRKRHTYGATDNIILAVHCGDHFMGDEFAQAEAPTLQIKAAGTGELSELAIVKDLRFVYTSDPEGKAVDFAWQDHEFEEGTHLYYVRVQQADGQIAWSSPLWITKR